MFAGPVRRASTDPYARAGGSRPASLVSPVYSSDRWGAEGGDEASQTGAHDGHGPPPRPATTLSRSNTTPTSFAPPPPLSRPPSRSASVVSSYGSRPSLGARSRSSSFLGSSAATSRVASPVSGPSSPTLAQRISQRIGAELLDTNPNSVALRHTVQADLSTLSTSLATFTSSLLALHQLLPPLHVAHCTSLSLLENYITLLTRLYSRWTELHLLAVQMVHLARVSEGAEVQSEVLGLSERVGRAEEGWRRVQVGFVIWANEVTKVQSGLGEETRAPRERVQQIRQTLHTAKLAVHSALQAVFRYLNLLSSKGVSIAMSLHFRRQGMEEHYFGSGEEEEVERVWMGVLVELEGARSTTRRLEGALRRCAGMDDGQRGAWMSGAGAQPRGMSRER